MPDSTDGSNIIGDDRLWRINIGDPGLGPLTPYPKAKEGASIGELVRVNATTCEGRKLLLR
jgi:hypothetical protein